MARDLDARRKGREPSGFDPEELQRSIVAGWALGRADARFPRLVRYPLMAGGAGNGLYNISQGNYFEGGVDLTGAGLLGLGSRRYLREDFGRGRQGLDLLGSLLRSDGRVTVAPAARPVPQGHTRVYRAVSEAEYQDILRTGRFNPHPNALEGRWFADSLEGAQAHGKGLYPDGNFRIIEADVPNNAPSLFQLPNLDGRGPARFLYLDDLQNVTPRPVGN